MYPVTEAVAALFDSNAPQVLRITGTDSNGNAINITDANVISGGFSIDRYSSSSNKLEIGTAISAELTLKIGNYDDAFSDIKFEGTELFVEVGVVDENNTTWIPCGYFTPDEQPRNRTIISLSALDRMMKFDAVPPALVPWTTQTGATMTDEMGNVLYFCSDLAFPSTVSGLVEQICALCGITLATSLDNLPNAAYAIETMPKFQQDVTFRNLIQWCAGLMGVNAFMDWNGQLRLGWYNGSTAYTTTPDRRYSSDLYENDITITGVSYTTSEQQMYLAGSDAYALDLSGNPMLAAADETTMSAVLQAIYNRVRGFTYRPFEAKVMPAPWLFPMDRVNFTDLKGNVHFSLLTNVNTTINGATVLKAAGETAQANSYTAPSGLTNAQQVAIRRVLQASNDLVNAAVDNATRQITGAENSHIRFMYDADGALTEILIMDTDDIATARNVWRWNSGGFGHSSNGYGGPYETAITQDGQIVATMITTGVLNASLLTAGIITDATGASSWNLTDGVFRITGEISSTGQPETGSTYESTTKVLGGAVYLYAGDDLVATIYGGGDSSSLVIKPESGYTVDIRGDTSVSSLTSDGDAYLGGMIYTREQGQTIYREGFNGTITDGTGTTFDVVNGLIMQ